MVARAIILVTLLAGLAVAQQPATDPRRAIELKPDTNGAVPAQQIRELLQRAEENDLENDKRQRDYTYVERVERHKLASDGSVKKTETWTSEILEIYGEPVGRVTARDNKPLSPEEAKKEDDKIQKIIDKRKNESRTTGASVWKKRKRIGKKTANLCWRLRTHSAFASSDQK
jgi:hypothetical protein